MPAPLFQYVWQYNNQPIEQLAQDIVNVLSANGNTGPVNTANYIPVSNGLTFDDSWLLTKDIGNNNCLATEFPTYGQVGINISPVLGQYSFGSYGPNFTGLFGRLLLDENNNYIGLFYNGGLNDYGIGVSSNGLLLGGQVSNSAGTASGNYLEIDVNGTAYKLQLLNP
jgi:hypothetical protein